MAVYNQMILHYFNVDSQVGSWPMTTGDVYTGIAGSKAQEVMLQLQLKIENDLICDAKYQVYGEPVVIAAIAYLSEQLINKKVDEAKNISANDIAAALTLAKTHYYCAIHVIEALRTAIKHYDHDQSR